VYVPGPLGRRFAFGRHRVGALHLVVSRGVGTTEVPVRAFAPPDVVVARLR
jgi:predicted MPP superfamily phosphohydrolase